ncbi:hypothetical protein AWB68_05612 [Caballeronia choica]|jgi:hypothetical protein|uniref:Uncharacterized protein n=1 Tax=Caballeronia choica TaxID=326476 RepID=A0A158KEW9_9BURK|nr:hypothetical protein [Caballeronia choica]SAL79339.1 hypothetical protein AWB68_05612 [Caballeronia choica]
MTKFDIAALARHRENLKAEGYRRISVFISPQLRCLLANHRRRGESTGALLDRLLVAELAARPHCSADNVQDARMIRRTQNQIRHTWQPSNNGPRTLSVKIREPDGSGVLITARDAVRFEKGKEPS